MKQEIEDTAKLSLTQKVETAIDETYVVVITYRPDLVTLKKQFSRLAQAGMRGVVVDNCSPTQSEIANLAKMYSLEVISLAENLGVARAQNVGIDYVKQKSGSYVVLLDQDSVPEDGAFEQLVRSYFSLHEQPKTGAIGSNYTLQTGYKGSSFVRFGWCHFSKIYCDGESNELHEVDFLISSGTFIPMAVLDEVGPMKEELFIDHVDTEWFLRAKSKGFRFYGSCSARMTHGLGEHTYRIWLGRWRTVPRHKAFRYFFMFRNSVWLYKQPYAPLKWITADVVRLIYIFLFLGVFVWSGIGNIKWMFKGVRAGWRGIDDPRSIDMVTDVKNSSLN